MERAALFIDGAYTRLAGNALVSDPSEDGWAECWAADFVAALSVVAARHSGLPILRSYWYDASPSGEAESPEHRELLAAQGVSLRLGRVVRERQKRVDTLLVSDLVEAAHHQPLASAYILAADEDIQPGIDTAQRHGVRVVLLGPPESDESRQSHVLVQAADEHVVVEAHLWTPFFHRHPPLPEPSTESFEVPADGSLRRRAFRFGEMYGQQFCQGATEHQIAFIRSAHPVIPQRVDAPLMRAAERTFGSLREHDEARQEIRFGFWAQIGTGAPIVTT